MALERPEWGRAGRVQGAVERTQPGRTAPLAGGGDQLLNPRYGFTTQPSHELARQLVLVCSNGVGRKPDGTLHEAKLFVAFDVVEIGQQCYRIRGVKLGLKPVEPKFRSWKRVALRKGLWV
jgi:hypothetical protein